MGRRKKSEKLKFKALNAPTNEGILKNLSYLKDRFFYWIIHFKEINQQALVVFGGTTNRCMNAEYEQEQFRIWLDNQIKSSKILLLFDFET
jgi:hypothetical protein